MREKLVEYETKFGESFPLALTRQYDDDQVMEIVDQCIRDDKPYSPKLDSKADY
jgi:hypothetical protein